MRKKGFLTFILSVIFAIGCANGADRAGANTTRTIQSKTQSRTTTNQTRKTTSARTTTERTTTPRTTRRQVVSSRSGLLYTPKNNKQVVGRAASTDIATGQSFGAEYNTCRDAYFTCMDQFCANIDETYRRCICSGRLNEIKQKQSAITQTTDSLTEFRDFNLDIINKSGAEVQSMTSATIGEQMASTATDKSNSAKQLNAISDVLSKAKSKSLSTSGMLDAGGDIKSIWSTTDLASGANIANLTGEQLYNAVNAQCSKMVADVCPASGLNMVISAYGMYIENDCSTLANNLSKQKNTANTVIRETGREMGVARIENYNAHNSLSINECIKSIRNDMTAKTACGPDFVHCLDVSGLYLNIDTGEPIYSTNFYNLANQISLSGNILNNQTNHMIVNELNRKKVFAQQSLDKCRDLSNDIWDEFMRQAIIEIHQKQNEKIRNVKTECLSVVNQCYDTQTNQLKDFSNDINNKTLLGLNLETVEDLCREKLDTCSNLYGGGPDGLTALVDAMRDIVNQKIVAECQNLLTDFGQNLCAVQSTDTIHAYPYACRVYAPGDQQYAAIPACNTATGTSANCGSDYTESLYRRFVNYAMQVCIRPSEYEELQNTGVPALVLQDINIVMDKMRIAMGNELSRECERLGGVWVTTPYTNTSIKLQEQFYNETGANKKWGYCKTPNATAQNYTITFDNNGSTNTTAIVTYGETMPSIIAPSGSGNLLFFGYYSEPNGGGTQYYNADGTATRTWDIASDTTLYAYWTQGVSVTFDGRGIYETDSCSTALPQSDQAQSVTCVANNSTRAGTAPLCPINVYCRTTYTFNGWCDGTCSTSSNNNSGTCNGTVVNTVTIPANTSGNKTYCATWTRTCETDCDGGIIIGQN